MSGAGEYAGDPPGYRPLPPDTDFCSHRPGRVRLLGKGQKVYRSVIRQRGEARHGYQVHDRRRCPIGRHYSRTRAAERSRAIHFINLPPVCTIRIYTLAGDLVQEIAHDFPGGGPQSQHEVWDVVSRNTQAVVTGIYLWQVNSQLGSQLGKLVIIK